MRRFAPLALCLLLLAAVRPAAAQVQTLPPDDSQVVTELTPVQVNLPGPAMWRVSRGDSQVVIVGFIRPLPHALDWPKGRLIHALEGAHALLMPPEPTLGVLDTVGFLLTLGRLQNPGGRTLAQVLSPQDYDDVRRAAERAHVPVKHYERYKPVIAGAALIGDVRRAEGLSSQKPVSTIERLARRMHIRVQPMGRLKAAPLVRIATGLDDRQGLECFRQEMAQIRWESSDAQAAAGSWAQGDVTALRRLKSRINVTQCLEDLPSLKAVIERGVTDAVSAMDEALSRPGKTVALVDLAYLDRADGLLDRLRAKGATVSVPE